MVTERMQQFDELILREVSKELHKLFPDEFFSITQVHVSKDLSFAKLWISSVKDIDKIVKISQENASEIRTVLAKKIKARKVPRLYFVADLTEEKAQHIENLIKEIKK